MTLRPKPPTTYGVVRECARALAREYSWLSPAIVTDRRSGLPSKVEFRTSPLGPLKSLSADQVVAQGMVLLGWGDQRARG